jgi:hypothetical protein
MLRALHLIPSHRVFAFTLNAACITGNQQIPISYLRFDPTFELEVEDTTEVMRSRKSVKDGQHKGQKKKDK